MMKKLLACLLCLCLLPLCALAEEPVTLRVLSGSEAEWEYEFLDAHPNIRVEHMQDGVYGAAYLTLLMTNDEYDVYTMNLGPTYASLVEKGYVLSLENAAGAEAFAAHLPAYLQATLMKDGKLYAVPTPAEEELFNIYYQGLGSYHAEGWQEENAGELPRTWAELLQRTLDWQENRADSAYQFFADDPGPGGLGAAILSAYVWHDEQEDAPLSFDTPEFREVMTLLKRYQASYNPNDVRPALLSTYGTLAPDADTPYVWRLPVTFTSEQASILVPDLRAYVINARTHHLDEALAYVGAALQAYSAPSMLLMDTTATGPVSWYGTTILTAEEAAQIQTLLPYVQTDLTSLFAGGDHYYAMEEFIQQYLQGELTLDLLVNKLNNRARMVFQENM